MDGTYKPGDEIPPEIRRSYLDRLKKWSDKMDKLTAEMAEVVNQSHPEIDYKSANAALDTSTKIVEHMATVFKNGAAEKKKSDEYK